MAKSVIMATFKKKKWICMKKGGLQRKTLMTINDLLNVDTDHVFSIWK